MTSSMAMTFFSNSAPSNILYEDPMGAMARLDVSRVATRLGDYNNVVDAAQRAAQSEHDTTLWHALRRNRKAVMWSLLLSTTLVMDGYDAFIINSFYGQQSFSARFGTLDSQTGQHYFSAGWQSGLSAGTLVGQIGGLIISGYMSQRFGYRRTLMGALVAMTIVILGIFFASTLTQLLVAEVICGLPWGAFQTLTTAYAADIAGPALRGHLASFNNMAWGIGILLSAGVVRGTMHLDDSEAYKLPFALQWLWPGPLILGIFFSPESPWWLVRNGRLQQASHSLRRLSHATMTDREIEEQLAMMRHTDAIERAETEGASYIDCFRKSNRRRTEIAAVVFGAQQCGSLIGFAVEFMQDAGMSENESFNFNVGVAAQYAIGTVFAWWIMAYVGRRPMYIAGLTSIGVIYFVIGVLGCFDHTEMAVGALLIVLSVCYSCSVGPTCYAIVAEIGSSRLRPTTLCLARIAYNACGILANVLTPRMVQSRAWDWGARAGFFWGAIAFLAALYCFYRLPETKHRTYGELDVLFEANAKARRFAKTRVDMFLHASNAHTVAAVVIADEPIGRTTSMFTLDEEDEEKDEDEDAL